MPRIRTVKWELFEDEALARCHRDGRLLFVGLICWADDFGNQRANPSLVRGHVFPYDGDLADDDVERLLDDLEGRGLIRTYEADGERFVHLRGWEKHQRIDNAGRPKVPEPDAEQREKGGKKRRAEPSRDEAPLSHLLADLMASNDPDGKRPKIPGAWAEAERLLQERDKRDPKQIEYVIRWSQRDDFERTVVHSMVKLRKRYGELVQKAKKAYDAERAGRGSPKPGTKAARVAELIERAK